MWQDFFYFSRAEKRGAVVLILLCLLLLISPYCWPDASQDDPADFRGFQRAVAEWQGIASAATPPSLTSSQRVGIPALFDPNAPEEEVLAALDLSERAIRAWMSYTAKGGRFRHPVDLDKFRALTPTERERVKPYLHFPEAAPPPPTEEAAPEYPERTTLHPFDPNQVTKEELLAFGVPVRAAANWSKFLEAGGRFRQASELTKIYGLPVEWAAQLMPFVQITESDKAVASELPTSAAPPTPQTNITIDINRATAIEWQQLYGIGPVLSERIVRFRDMLGGFHRVTQVGETYGLPDSTFERILPQLTPSAILRPIYINQATEQELAAHPYIHRLSAQLIANYRREHGAFQSIADLDKLYGLEEGFVEKIRPYLVFE